MGHGTPSSYTRLIDCDRLTHSYNTVTDRLHSSYSHTGCGGPSTLMGAATSGSSATHVQAVGGIHSNGGQLPPDQAPPSQTTSFGVRSPGQRWRSRSYWWSCYCFGYAQGQQLGSASLETTSIETMEISWHNSRGAVANIATRKPCNVATTLTR